MLYLWLKALHIIFVVCWFAGIFYLPRLFVYHAMTDNDNTASQLLVMERKLYNFITPLAILAIIFGIALIATNMNYYFSSLWFLIKLALIVPLVIYHLQCGRYIKRFEAGEKPRSHIFYRWFNEAPVILLFAIVILAVTKPFI